MNAGQMVISMVEEMREVNPNLPRYALFYESNTYLCLGQMFGVQGEGLRAIEYFEKYRDTATSMGDDCGIKDAEAHIQQEKMKLEVLHQRVSMIFEGNTHIRSRSLGRSHRNRL